MRTVGGVPMILRTLRAVTESGVADRIVVTTDWPELREFCELRGYEVLERPAELAADDTPLEPVARHAVGALGWTGDVGIFQPTCPLLEPETIREAIKGFTGGWAISAAPAPHIVWGETRPLVPRVNRQGIDLWRESGAIQLMSSGALAGGGGPDRIFEIPSREALDVDTVDDLLLAERLASFRRIHFVVAGGRAIGSGHLHRCTHLARLLGHHGITWSWAHHHPGVCDLPGPPPMDGVAPHVVVFDCLEVPEYDLLSARTAGSRVVVLEDEGAASGRLADLRVNEMLWAGDLGYVTLREEFLCLPTRAHDELVGARPRILVTFGGTDPAGLTGLVTQELSGYDLDVVEPGTRVSMARAMRDADVVVTGQGRTVFEAAACGTPCVSIAANEREARHVRIPGVIYMGLWANRTRRVVDVVTDVCASAALRREMAAAARAAIPDDGAERLARAIEDLAR